MRLSMMHRGECYPQRPRRGRSWILSRVVRIWNEGESGHKRNAASSRRLSLSMKCPCKVRREGDNGRGSASPTVCTLPMVPCGSSPVTCVLSSPLRCEKRSAWGGGWTQWVKSGKGASKNCIEKQHSHTLHRLWSIPYLHKKFYP